MGEKYVTIALDSADNSGEMTGLPNLYDTLEVRLTGYGAGVVAADLRIYLTDILDGELDSLITPVAFTDSGLGYYVATVALSTTELVSYFAGAADQGVRIPNWFIYDITKKETLVNAKLPVQNAPWTADMDNPADAGAPGDVDYAPLTHVGSLSHAQIEDNLAKDGATDPVGATAMKLKKIALYDRTQDKYFEIYLDDGSIVVTDTEVT